MSLSRSEEESAFVTYCLAFAGLVPTADIDNMVIAAAFALGACERENASSTMTRAEVAAAVEAALAEPGEGGERSEERDIVQAGLEAYAEGVGDVLDALDKWLPPHLTYPGGTALSVAEITLWIAARRAAGPKRGMTAGDVIGRIEKWSHPQNRQTVGEFVADLRVEIEGSSR